MKYFFRIFLVIVFASPYIVGCSSYTQPTITGTTSINPTATIYQPTLTLIPTSPPAPTFAPIILPTATPLPQNIFDLFSREYNINTVKTAFGSISTGEVIEEHILVDNTIGGIHFTLAWREGDLDLNLVQPDGTVIDSTAIGTKENVSLISDSTHEEYYIDSPQWGTWTIRIFGKSIPLTGNRYALEAYSLACPMRISVDFDKDYYVSGDSIKLSANIEDLISLTSDRIYVHGAVIQVTVNDPATHQHSFELFDDGYHGDGNADDGIYANVFSNTQLVGEYNFYIQISGITNWNGGWGVGKLPFTREFFRSTVVH